MCLGEVQVCIWPSWYNCHSLSLAPVNLYWFYFPGFTFLLPAHPGSPGQVKRAVKWSCVSLCQWQNFENQLAFGEDMAKSWLFWFFHWRVVSCDCAQRRELMACAPTGSGKTLAFVIPLLRHLQRPCTGGVRALVLSPTRELAEQVGISLFITHASSTWCMGSVITGVCYFVCLSVCMCFKGKTIWTTNTSLGTLWQDLHIHWPWDK